MHNPCTDQFFHFSPMKIVEDLRILNPLILERQRTRLGSPGPGLACAHA
jgi:hypothetical protein